MCAHCSDESHDAWFDRGMHFDPCRIQILGNGSSVEKARDGCNLRRLKQRMSSIHDLLSESCVRLGNDFRPLLLDSENELPSSDCDGTSFPGHGRIT